MKKGFTLIELLGVLAILAILAIITVPLIQGILEDSNENSRKIQEQSFEKAAEDWASANVFALPVVGAFQYISLNDLIEQGYLEANKKDGEYYINISGSNDECYNLENSRVKISNNGTAEKAKYKYEFEENSGNC